MKKWLCLLLALCMLLTCAGLSEGDIITEETTPVTVPDSADEDQPTGADTQIDGSASGADPQEGESQAGSGEGADSGETPEGSSDSGQTDEPGGSGEPTDPSDPAVPVEPADPDAPVDPADPDAPATPEGPETPEDPADPENPDEPEDPENPVQPDQPVDGEIDWDEVRSGEVWHETSDGEIIFGKLEDVLTALLTGGEPLDEENPLLIYICRDEVLRVREIRRGDVYYFAFAIDEVALPEAKDRQIVISETDPDAPAPDSGADDDQTEPDPEQIISLYVYLEQEQDPQPDDPEPEEPVLSVIASDYVADAWSNTVPVFALSGIPEDKAYWEYGVVRYGSTHVDIIEDGAFSALEEGEYTLRFVMLDELGNVVSASDLYTVKLDYTEPEIVAVNTDTGVSYQMVINAWDELSGAAQFSIDGGETWLDPEEGSMVYTALSKTTIEGGQIMVRDVAGNTAVWPDEVELKRASSGGYYGGGGGGGGGSRGIVHTKSSGFSKREYDTVNVSSEGGDAVTYMHTLTLDGQPMDLTLDLDRALGFAYDETYEPVFAMSLLYWADEPVSEDDGEDEPADAKTPDPNTLVLIAANEDVNKASDNYAYRWSFNGSILRQLGKSGISYLALVIDDYVVAMPTEGFLAGEDYVALKMQGVPTRGFDYEVVMAYEDTDGEASAGKYEPADILARWLYEITVTHEDVSVQLTDDDEQPMYMVGICAGLDSVFDSVYGAAQKS